MREAIVEANCWERQVRERQLLREANCWERLKLLREARAEGTGLHLKQQIINKDRSSSLWYCFLQINFKYKLYLQGTRINGARPVYSNEWGWASEMRWDEISEMRWTSEDERVRWDKMRWDEWDEMSEMRWVRWDEWDEWGLHLKQQIINKDW